MIKPINPT